MKIKKILKIGDYIRHVDSGTVFKVYYVEHTSKKYFVSVVDKKDRSSVLVFNTTVEGVLFGGINARIEDYTRVYDWNGSTNKGYVLLSFMIAMCILNGIAIVNNWHATAFITEFILWILLAIVFYFVGKSDDAK
jgi:hypothetical protein